MSAEPNWDEWERLCEAATPGPWQAGAGDEEFSVVHAVQPEIGYPIAEMVWLDRGKARALANRDFLAAARTALPAALAERKRLAAEVARLRAALADIARETGTPYARTAQAALDA